MGIVVGTETSILTACAGFCEKGGLVVCEVRDSAPEQLSPEAEH